MYGRHKARPQEKVDDGVLQVADVFYTIQGEGPLSGAPAVFVRLTGCNLRCWFCDTDWDDSKDPYHTVAELVNRVTDAEGAQDCKLVVLTGGEPMRQASVDTFVQELLRSGYHVQIETAGTIFRVCMTWPGVTVVCSPKTKFVHPEVENWVGEWKYVVKAGCIDDSGLPSEPMQRRAQPGTDAESYTGGTPARPPASVPKSKIRLMPMDEQDEELNAYNRLTVVQAVLKHGYHAGVQMHKILDVA
jgi:7-carboxy-7-deazaguanine synthase